MKQQQAWTVPRRRGDVSRFLRRPTYGSTAGLAASCLLLFGCLLPLASTYLGLLDLSGSEGALAVALWLSAIVLGGARPTHLDAIILALLLWELASAVGNQVSPMGALLQFAFLSAPFTFLRVAMLSDASGLSWLKDTVKFLAAAQIAMLVFQLATRTGIDDLKGTFTGTQYGEHVASFVVLVSAAWYASEHPRTWRARTAILGALGIAFVADSKIAIGYFLIVGITYLIIGRAPSTSPRAPIAARIALAVLAVGLAWGFYTGALGNIPVNGYVDQSLAGGGKVAVTQSLVDPGSEFWKSESLVLGAGPGQTVSRTAELTVPNSYGSAPALRFGATPAEYYTAFENQTRSSGYISDSSSTAAASSVLGVLGDLGWVGLGIMAAGWLSVWNWLSAVLPRTSWAGLAWLIFLVPGFIGEWLEFPAACMFLVAVLVILRDNNDPSRAPLLTKSA